eukprot:GSChrysophyteH2.ASY1.ANO1.768.1 assembled CDS
MRCEKLEREAAQRKEAAKTRNVKKERLEAQQRQRDADFAKQCLARREEASSASASFSAVKSDPDAAQDPSNHGPALKKRRCESPDQQQLEQQQQQQQQASWEKEVVSGVEPTPDDSDKHVWPTFLAAHKHYGFPGSHQVGSWGNKEGILRTYSNSTVGKDVVPVNKGGHEIWYMLKDEVVKAKFKANLRSGQPLRFFRKVALPLPLPAVQGRVQGQGERQKKGKREFGCKDTGVFRVVGFGCVGTACGDAASGTGTRQLRRQNTHGEGFDSHVRLVEVEGVVEEEEQGGDRRVWAAEQCSVRGGCQVI